MRLKTVTASTIHEALIYLSLEMQRDALLAAHADFEQFLGLETASTIPDEKPADFDEAAAAGVLCEYAPFDVFDALIRLEFEASRAWTKWISQGSPPTEANLKKLVGTPADVFNYIKEHAGSTGKEIASALSVHIKSVDRHVRALRRHGVRNERHGYFVDDRRGTSLEPRS